MRLCAIVRNMRSRGSRWATFGVFACSAVLRAAACSAVPSAPLMRGWVQVGSSRRRGEAAKKSPRVHVLGGVVDQHRVVDVPGLLPPRVEHDLLPGMVGMQRRDHALQRVVEQDRADADTHVELELVRRGEERLVLAHRLALVVEDRPTAADPARDRRRLPSPTDSTAVPALPGSSSGSRARSHRNRRSCAGSWSARPAASRRRGSRARAYRQSSGAGCASSRVSKVGERSYTSGWWRRTGCCVDR